MEEGTLIAKFERLKSVMSMYGQDMTQGMLLLVILLILLHWFMRRLRTYLNEKKGKTWPVGMVTGIIYILLLVVVFTVAFVFMGFDGRTIVRTLAILSLSGIAIMILLRPYFPTLPFHVGNTVIISGLFGKVEAMNMYHTQLKTFDGKTVFIPNSKILAGVVINYHHTPSRRVKINVRIPLKADLLKAKQVIEAIMIEDPRVMKTPRPQVWVLNLDHGSVELGARCWTSNAKMWLTKCDLTEKIKMRLDNENIPIAIPRRIVQLAREDADAAALADADEQMAELGGDR